MKRYRIMLSFTVLLIFIGALTITLTNKEKSMIGIWQDSMVMASGWSNTYSFFPDRSFIFRYNTMDCDKRDLEVKGTWKIDRNSLVLTITSKVHITGGRLVKATGSCGSDLELVDGTTVKTAVNPPVVKSLPITGFINAGAHKDASKYSSISIGGTRYWKFSADPDSY